MIFVNILVGFIFLNFFFFFFFAKTSQGKENIMMISCLFKFHPVTGAK